MDGQIAVRLTPATRGIIKRHMKLETFPVAPLGCNCTILVDEPSGRAVVVDPGGEAERILRVLEALDARPIAIVHTHAHIDHVGATPTLATRFDAPVYLNPHDRFLYEMLPVQAQLLGLPPVERAGEIRDLEDEQVLRLDDFEVGVVHTPGHTPGSVSLVVPQHELCLSGDTLFAGGIGRTDLWGGDYHTLERSIRDRLYRLHGATQVIPGHGPATRIDIERRTNPFVRA